MDESIEQPVIFYDGVCGLCNRFVDFVISRDTQARFRFAPLQGATAAAMLPARDTENIRSVVVVHRGQVLRHSSAIVKVFREMGGLWAVLGCLLWLIPRPLRNFGYRIVASQRYRLFGQKETCRLPTPDERTRFLN